MKILQLALSLGTGGAERIAVGLCNRFAENQDDEIVLVSILDDAIQRNIHYLKDLSPRVRFINLHCKSGLQLKAIWGVYRIIKKERPTIVHCHTNVLLLFFPAFFIKDVCYIHTIHNLVHKILNRSGLLKSLVMKYLFCRSNIKPVTISETCHQSYLRTNKTNNDICIINGSEPLNISDKFESVKTEIAGLKKNSETIVFIHVGRNHPQKNHDRLFSTFLRLEREDINFILIVLGEHYEPWQKKLENSNRIFLQGTKRNVGDYMSQSDFFVLSSDYEGLPMTLLEAMSMGIVPISTPAGGVVDVIEDGVTGYLTKNFDDEEFYQKVKLALYEKGKISSEKIKKSFEKNFSMDACANRYYETYRRLIN